MSTVQERLERVRAWHQTQTRVTAFKFRGTDIVRVEGVINQEPRPNSGLWGYAGDSIAVVINGEFWPSANVSEKESSEYAT
jgi:hypothetical protein